jgi:peptidoglycan/LPS O-acetylase OafA/YrhL
LEQARHDLPWYLLYWSNCLWPLSDRGVADFFGWAAVRPAERPSELLGPTWSLAVEEQFYPLWSGLVFLFWNRFRYPLAILIATAVAARPFFVLTVQNWADASYMATISRGNSLPIGAALADYARSAALRAVHRDRFAAFGLYLCLPAAPLFQLAVPGRQNAVLSVVGYSILALRFARLLAQVVRERDRRNRLAVEWRGFRWFGNSSYGINLHQMIGWYFMNL